MSVPIVEISVLTASLLGSSHCIGMCGGIALQLHEKKSSQIAYHLGRLVAYLAIGFIFGFIGNKLFNSNPAQFSRSFQIFSTMISLLIAIFFIFSGIQSIRLQPMHFPNSPFSNIASKAFGFTSTINHPVLKSLLIGLATPLLPCGWLYSFVAAALAKANPIDGCLLLTVFWIGTVPGLVLGVSFFKTALIKLKNRGGLAQVLSGVLLITSGVYSLGVRHPWNNTSSDQLNPVKQITSEEHKSVEQHHCH